MTQQPLSMDEAWVALHEAFLAARKAGFTETQACAIIGTMLAAQQRDQGTTQ